MYFRKSIYGDSAKYSNRFSKNSFVERTALYTAKQNFPFDHKDQDSGTNY